MRIGILTGGGDVPSLNACIKAIVNRAADNDWQVLGFRRGWAGPLYLDSGSIETPSDAYTPLENRLIRDIDRTGGAVHQLRRPVGWRIDTQHFEEGLRIVELQSRKDGIDGHKAQPVGTNLHRINLHSLRRS